MTTPITRPPKKPGSQPGAKPRKWTPEMDAELRRLYPYQGSIPTAAAMGLSRPSVKARAERLGLCCVHGAHPQSRKKQAPTAAAQAMKSGLFVDQKPLIHSARSAQRPVSTATVDTSRARITIAPPKLDTRFQPEPGYVGEFSRLKPGQYLPEDA